MIAALMLIMQGTCVCSSADGTKIPSDATEMEPDREYWLEGGETAWFRFTAPAEYCYLTDLPLQKIGEWYYGSDVRSNRLYSASGEDLGIVTSSNDPDEGGWNEFTPGETYYLRVDPIEGTRVVLSPVKEALPSADTHLDAIDCGELALKECGVEKFFPGETTLKWDVYTLTAKLNLPGGIGYVCSTDFFAAPYRIRFGASEMTTSSGRVIYSSVEGACSDTAAGPASYTGKPKALEAGEGEYLFAANQYSNLTGADGYVSLTRSYEVYVPAGKRLVRDDGGFYRDMRAEDVYSDVKAGSWYSAAVKWCLENGCMSGTGGGKFSPSSEVTRAQLVLILARLCGADLSAYKDRQTFSDVPAGRWYSEAVEWAAQTGVTAGTGEGIFDPSRPVSRQQLAVFLCAFGRLTGVSIPDGADISGFADSEDVAGWARDGMERAVAAGLISGTENGRLSPRSNATRAQTAVMIKRFSENLLAPTEKKVGNGNYCLIGDTCGYSVYAEMIALSGKENPKVLFIGMAATDPEAGANGCRADFQRQDDGCVVEALKLTDLSDGTAAEKIAAADIIFVDGGSSHMLLSRLRRYGTDALLREAAANGTVMCGSSAGAICFGAYGTSGVGTDRFVNLAGVGCVDMVVCPHGFETARIEELKSFLLADPSYIGVSAGGCALEISHGEYRFYAEEDVESRAFVYRAVGGEIVSRDVFSMEWRPLSELYG